MSLPRRNRTPRCPARLPPWVDPAKPAALPGSTSSFGRLCDPDLIRAACHERPRTLAFESVTLGDPEGWTALACSHLTRLTGAICPGRGGPFFPGQPGARASKRPPGTR
jgi:hypothetical protein